MNLDYLNRPVTSVKGIGPARAASLAEQGIRSLMDLLLLLPRRYHERPAPGSMRLIKEGESCAAQGVVEKARVSGRGRRRNLIVEVIDDDRSVELVLFNRGYLKSGFKRGRAITFQGKATSHKDTIQLLSPDYHLDGDPGQGFPGRVPVYSLPPGLFPRTFHRIIDEIFDNLGPLPDADWRDEAGVPLRDLMPILHALKHAHRPASIEEAEAARRRIAYEEFFAFQLGLAVQRRDRDRAFLKKNPVSKKTTSRASRGEKTPILSMDRLEEQYGACLPFRLTDAQKKAIRDIRADLESPLPMHRLLQGDVGSGKTVVALYPLLAAALRGGQGALMAPTEVLARQHCEVLEKMLAPVGIAPSFLPAGLSAKGVRTLLDAKETRIVVGTHALIQQRIVFRDLRVCVIDEQHKFGVRQRWNLKRKGEEPDVLVMTATPIPRSLALTLYGELDVTTLDTLPPGRRPIETIHVSDLKDQKLLDWLEAELRGEGRIFFVCPLVNESEKLDLEAAVRLHGHVERRFRSLSKTMLLHGKMSAQAKARSLDAFRSGEARLLVTTVVVEVGVDVPEASTVVILDAWRFGLAQLHQIRGRVGRGERPSRCYLVGEPNTEAGRRRIKILVETNNGFVIAEEDLKMRGPGEVLGLKQHGLPALRAGDYVADVDLMVAARDDARILVASGSQPPVKEVLMYEELQRRPWIG